MPSLGARPGIQVVDLNFQRLPSVVAVFLISDGTEVGLVETGPGSTLPALVAALAPFGGPQRLSAIAVTHIHLDHAGAAGELLRIAPNARCYVHSLGAPHLLDPSKLLGSARRIYGDQMETLWGRIEPAPEERVIQVEDGDTIRVGGVDLGVLYTPGHASHHVAFHDAEHRAVFTGDVAGVRMPGFRHVRPPTPPPDIDVERWHASVDRIRQLYPLTLFMTHFGAQSADLDRQFADLLGRLDAWTRLIRRGVEDGRDSETMVETLRREADGDVVASGGDAAMLQEYSLASPYEMSVTGLVRYVTKGGHAVPPAS
jgi:glyoxylase-like metal-dependent hydrolase (beta-lactamase superfamily II)